METLECETSSYQDDVTQLHLCCVGFEEAVPYLSKLPVALPHVTVSWAPVTTTHTHTHTHITRDNVTCIVCT